MKGSDKDKVVEDKRVRGEKRRKGDAEEIKERRGEDEREERMSEKRE